MIISQRIANCKLQEHGCDVPLRDHEEDRRKLHQEELKAVGTVCPNGNSYAGYQDSLMQEVMQYFNMTAGWCLRIGSLGEPKVLER